MVGTTLITLTPLSKSLFRWFGDPSPMLRGPMTAMTSEAVPLPTTVAGALYRAFDGKMITDGVNHERLHRELMRVMGCGEEAPVRGPYILIHRAGEPGDWRAACFHNMGKGPKLVCTGRGGEALSPGLGLAVRQSVGIALDSRRRAVIEGLIYTKTAIDLRALAETLGKGLEASVAVEIGCEIDEKELRLALIPLGGDSHPARVRITKASPLTQAPKGDIAYFATPYLLKPETAKDLLNTMSTSPKKAIKAVAEIAGITEPDPRASKVIIGLAPTGYDTARTRNGVKGVPRPTHPAIMPGTHIAPATDEKPRPPNPQPLGYGTIVTLTKQVIEQLAR